MGGTSRPSGRGRRTAEHCDELAPFYLIELHPIPHERAVHGRISKWPESVSPRSEHHEDFGNGVRPHCLSTARMEPTSATQCRRERDQICVLGTS